MALPQPLGVIEIGERGEALAKGLHGREVPDPEQLLGWGTVSRDSLLRYRSYGRR
jgi:hypothetical protein